jgi:hypothetical protein
MVFINSSARIPGANYVSTDTLSIKSLPKKAHSVKVIKGEKMGEEGVSPDTEDYSSTSVDGK